MQMQNPLAMEMVERDAHRAELRYAEAKARSLLDEGEAPPEDKVLLRKLEQDWKEALQRLQAARRHAKR